MRIGIVAFALTLVEVSFAASRAIPAGAITVDKNGAGKYTTISAALADTSSNIYYVYAGNYTEGVSITRANVIIYGATSDANSYTSNTVTVSRNEPASVAGSNDKSGTVRVEAAGVSLYNLNIENTYGKPVDQAQAIALSVEAGTFGCYGCALFGVQDTLLADKGTQFYGNSLIVGGVDFIFGMSASIWITGSTIQTLRSGCITASGRSSDDANYYVIDHSTITGTGDVYLGRPWRDYARVIFQYSVLPSTIDPAGWSEWSTSTPNTDHVTFGEYANTGAGAWNSNRASFATLLTSPISIGTVLGSTSWVDPAYLSGSTPPPPPTTTTTASTTTKTSTTSTKTTSTKTSSTKTSTTSTKTTSTKTSSTTTKSTSTATGTVGEYNQCGGIGWTGGTVCVAPYTCVYSNDYYSQCL